MNFQRSALSDLALSAVPLQKIKANCPETQIYATAHHIETIQEAYKEGIIENSNLLSMSDFSECDCIFLCAPVQRNLDYLAQLKDIIKRIATSQMSAAQKQKSTRRSSALAWKPTLSEVIQ